MIFTIIINYFPALPGDESQILEIEDVELHPKYDPFKAYQDISVIRLKPNISKLQKSYGRSIGILHLVYIELLDSLYCTLISIQVRVSKVVANHK